MPRPPSATGCGPPCPRPSPRIASSRPGSADIPVNDALSLARMWRQIGELRTWRPLADAGASRDAEIVRFRDARLGRNRGLARVNSGADWGPVLSAPAAPRSTGSAPTSSPRTRRDISRRRAFGGMKPAKADPPALLVGAGALSSPAGLRIGVDWMAQFLECATAAALTGLREAGAAHRGREKTCGYSRYRAIPAARRP